jgi:polysaccharide biosynthesis/export protein
MLEFPGFLASDAPPRIDIFSVRRVRTPSKLSSFNGQDMRMHRLWLLAAFLCACAVATVTAAQDRTIQDRVVPGTGAPAPGSSPMPSGAPVITNRVQPNLPRDGFESPVVSPGLPTAPPPPNEFQEFVATSLGRSLPLFGHNLFYGTPSTFAPVDRVPVTPDYVLGPGDEIVIRAWGQVDIDYRTTVDRNGAIHIPQIGTLNVGGLRYQDLHGFIRSHISRIFRNFELSVMLGQLRSIQLFIVGQAKRPGAYTVSSLSTLVNALFASGGPSTKGSMRRIQLKRGNDVVTEFDLYDLLIRGDKSKDARLQPGDVIYIPPIGDLVAISGSVNEPAVYELKGASSLGDLIQLAGGLATTAEGQKATVERIADRRARRVAEFSLDNAGLSRPIHDGDLVQIRALSPRFENAVTLRGAVAVAGRYPWREGLRVRDVIPTRDALIVPDYWQRQNEAPRSSLGREARARLDFERSQLEGASRQRDDSRSRDNSRLRDEQSRLRNDASPRDELRSREDTRARDDIRREELRLQGQGEQRLRTEIKRTYDEINWDYAVIERLNYDDLTTMLIPFNLGRAVLEGDAIHNLVLRPGDVITIFSKADIQVPVAKQTKFVRLEGELVTPGVYQILPGETLRQLVARVGGTTVNSYLYGSEFTRESVRIQQQKRLDEALDRLAQEIERTAAAKTQTGLDTDAAAAQLQAESQRKLLDRMRDVKATGRIVLDIPQNRAELSTLPEVALEDGDRFFVPSRPSTVGVIGAVYNQNTFVYANGKRVGDYLDHAGGATRDADTGRIYIVRADGSITGRAHGSFFSVFNAGERLMPGDTIVVPENFERFRLTKELKDWSQIFYQFALGVAGLKVLKDF